MQEITSQYTGRERRGRIKVSHPQTTRNILVVDDEETIGIGITGILKDAGFNADYVTNGDRAITEFSKKPYLLVFMDMVMPGMDGLETFRRIKKIRNDARVVLFTGYFKDAEKIISEGIREGMIEEFLRKPFFAEEIIKTARKYT